MSILETLRNETVSPVVMADQEGLVTWINSPFEAAFGWSLKDLEGRLLTKIMPEKFKNAHNIGFSRFLQYGTHKVINRPLQLTIVHKDGREEDAVHMIVAEQEHGEWVFAATIHPADTHQGT